MSFFRPTESSLRRAQTTLKEQQRQTTSTVAAAAQTLPVRRASLDPPAPDYSHVPSRVDSGLRSRVQTSFLSWRGVRSAAPSDSFANSPSLREFNRKCDSVMRRAQELLNRTQEQELRVARALEERLSQSPTPLRGTPSPPLSQGDGTTTSTSAAATQQQQQHQEAQRQHTPPPVPDAIPAVPSSPHQTPATPSQPARNMGDAEGHAPSVAQRPTSPSPSRHGLSGWFGLRAPSPSLPPLPAPPPTPVEPQRCCPVANSTNAAAAPGAASRATLTGTRPTAEGSSSPSSPSFLQRIRQSLQRTPSASVEASPAPRPNTTSAAPSVEALQNGSCQDAPLLHPAPASPRKSVKFVSPDKLESVTPTKAVAFTDSDSASEEEEEEEREGEVEAARTSADQPPRKRSRADTPKRDSVVLPPAPPPSAVKSPAKKERESVDRQPSARSRTSSPKSHRSSTGSRSRSPSSSSSTASRRSFSRAYSMHHDEVKAYVMQHTIRQSLATLNKKEMKLFLKEEGSPLATERHVLKKRLLAEVRTLIKKQAEM